MRKPLRKMDRPDELVCSTKDKSNVNNLKN